DLIDADPDAPEPRIALVGVLVQSNQKEKAAQAVADAERALTADSALMSIGRCYELIGRTDEALAKYQRALEVSPNDREAMRRCIEFHLRHNQPQDAEQLSRKLLGNSPETEEGEYREATRPLAMALALVGTRKGLSEALKLVEQNLAHDESPR